MYSAALEILKIFDQKTVGDKRLMLRRALWRMGKRDSIDSIGI